MQLLAVAEGGATANLACLVLGVICSAWDTNGTTSLTPYRNDRFGFSLQVPRGTRILGSATGTGALFQVGAVTIRVWGFPNELRIVGQNELADKFRWKALGPVREVRIAGLDGIEFDHARDGISRASLHRIVLDGEVLYGFSVEGDSAPPSRGRRLFEEIVASFRSTPRPDR